MQVQVKLNAIMDERIALQRSLVLTVLLLSLSLLAVVVSGTEMTIELPDRDQQCFYEEIPKDTDCVLEFQVVSGGNYDVDMALYGPEQAELYSAKRRSYDTIDFKADVAGEYHFCFSNQFSSFTHKLVYFNFVVGEEEPLSEDLNPTGPLTQLETSCVRVHEALKIVESYQRHHKVKEAQGRDTAEALNERVQYWSLGEGVLFVAIGLLQVFVLRMFFTEKRSNI